MRQGIIDQFWKGVSKQAPEPLAETSKAKESEDDSSSKGEADDLEKERVKIKTNEPNLTGASSKKTMASVLPAEVVMKLNYKQDTSGDLEDEAYNPKKHAPWDPTQETPFFFICQGFDKLGEQKGNNSVERKKKILSNLFKTIQTLSPNEVVKYYLFSTCRLDSEYIQGDIGVGTEILFKAAAFATGHKRKGIKDDVAKEGDLGIVIENKKSKTQTMDSFFSKQKDTRRITVLSV